MTHAITVTFGPGSDYDFMVSNEEKAGLSRDQARAWLAKEFEALECTPTNPMGKVLVLDMILNVAKYGGEARFQAGGEWAQRFAQAVAVCLDRPALRVDVPGFIVG